MSYAGLIEATVRVNDFLNAGSVLSWGARTMMPKAGAENRSKQLATLAVAARNLLCSDEIKRALEGAQADVSSRPEDSAEARVVTQVSEAIDYHERIPTELLRRKTELGAAAHEVWAEAREKADYAPLRNWLTDNVAQHGRRYKRDELLVNATGRTLDPEPYIAHMTCKFSDIYALS